MDVSADGLVSPDALALVRFGLRSANDPRMQDTVKVIDHLLRTELPQGPGWRRYNNDGYGEHPDGRPFDGTGQGRVWPLLTGERAHFALAAGDRDEALRLLATMEASSSRGGLLPEQVWDAEDIPALELVRGRPSGSAMPLVWAHAEHVKLMRSLADGAVFDMPPQTVRRFQTEAVRSRLRTWRATWRRSTLPVGQKLRIELAQPATLHWTLDNWQTTNDTPTTDTQLGIHAALLNTDAMPAGTRLVFTWRNADGTWLGEDHAVVITAAS
jgi:glucoamylase